MLKQKRPFLQDYQDLFRFTRPQLKLLAAAVFCMMVSTLFDGVSMGMVVPFSDKILSNGMIVVPTQLPAFAQQFVDRLNGMSQLTLLYGMAFFLIALFLLKGFFTYFQSSTISL